MQSFKPDTFEDNISCDEL